MVNFAFIRTHTNIYDNNQASVPKIWDQLWILNRLDKGSHTYSFQSFYSI